MNNSQQERKSYEARVHLNNVDCMRFNRRIPPIASQVCRRQRQLYKNKNNIDILLPVPLYVFLVL